MLTTSAQDAAIAVEEVERLIRADVGALPAQPARYAAAQLRRAAHRAITAAAFLERHATRLDRAAQR